MCYIRKKILCHYICVPWIIFGGILMPIAFISFWAFGGMSVLTLIVLSLTLTVIAITRFNSSIARTTLNLRYPMS